MAAGRLGFSQKSDLSLGDSQRQGQGHQGSEKYDLSQKSVTTDSNNSNG